MISRVVSARPGSLLKYSQCSQASLHTSTRRLRFKHGRIPLLPNGLLGAAGVQPKDLDELLATPIWSVESLLPPKTEPLDAPKISSQQLHHLLRLSALPLPETPEEETKMLDTLAAQLHFVGQMQQVDTTGVKPLRAIRDETAAAEREQAITLDTLKEALAQEEIVGKHYKRIQRNPDMVDATEVENWDVLGSAKRKVGNYFVVESERPQE